MYDGSGHRHNATLDESGLLGILEAGDLNPALRALLPAAVHSALNNYPDPLLRLEALAEGLIPSVPGGHAVEESEEIDEALYVTTTCEEMPFPWQRSAPAATRLAEATAALKALPSTDFYPFDAATALGNSLISPCAGWPDAAAASAQSGVLPNVPTLIFSGAQDLRTPTSNARAVAAKIPDAQLLVVPYTGHSVIGSDFSDCASLAVTAFFAGGPGGEIQPCVPGANPFAPTPLTPTKLAYVHPVPGLSGRPSLTLTAVLDTIVDLNRQVVGATLQADAQLPSGSSFGGLRGGYAKLSTSKLALTRFTFIPGVELSGTFPVSKGQLQTTTLQITGSSAAHGTVRVGSGKQVTGTLGGTRFDVNIAKVKLSCAPAAADAGRRAKPNGPRCRSPSRCRGSRGCADEPRGYAERVPNALAAETSPYLRQHSENPVDWLPWGPVALTRAVAEDKPLLVSIGYSSCHWCHVMERESFENPRTAALMNELFVCVKVDREERPDVDALYMEAVQSDDRPRRLAAERIPHARAAAVLRRHLLPARAPSRDAGVDAGAAGARRGLGGAARGDPRGRRGPARAAVRRRRTEALGRAARFRARSMGPSRTCGHLFDPVNGGFGGAPKFPQASVIEFLLARAAGYVEPAASADADPSAGASTEAEPDGGRNGPGDAPRDGRRRHPRPPRRRIRALQRRRDLDGAALREDALRQRAARARVSARVPALTRAPLGGGLPRHARLGAARDARRRGRLLLGARRRLGGRRGTLLRVDSRRTARRARRQRRGRRDRVVRSDRGG